MASIGQSPLAAGAFPLVALVFCCAVAVIFLSLLPAGSRGATTDIVLRLDGATYSLQQGSTLIGRSGEAGISLSASDVSRRHARIFLSGERLTLEDLGSGNGTFVNGRRIHERTEVYPGDILSFASARATIVLIGEERL
jgi:pSer/pThr/pTyr-binding forkhead associated (FHA) protein